MREEGKGSSAVVYTVREGRVFTLRCIESSPSPFSSEKWMKPLAVHQFYGPSRLVACSPSAHLILDSLESFDLNHWYFLIMQIKLKKLLNFSLCCLIGLVILHQGVLRREPQYWPRKQVTIDEQWYNWTTFCNLEQQFQAHPLENLGVQKLPNHTTGLSRAVRVK